MEMKTKQVEMMKYKFEYRGMSRLKALSGKSGLSRFHRRKKNQRFSNQIFQLT